MAQTEITKDFTNFLGLDLRSSDLNRPPGYATSFLNKQIRKSGAIETRLGYKAGLSSLGGNGLFVFKRTDKTTGAKTDELLTVDNNLHRAIATTFTISYVGASTCVFRLFLDTSASPYVFKAQIDEGSTENRLNYSLGNGFDEASPVTLANLKTQIDAISGGNFSATIGGAGVTSIPAAFLPLVRDASFLNGTNLALTAYSWQEVNDTVTNPLAGSETNRNASDFENVSSVQLNEVLYLSNGYDDPLKYDGQTIFRSGMPEGGKPTIAESSHSGAALNVSRFVCDTEANTPNGSGVVLFDKNGSVGVFVDKNAGNIPIPDYFAGCTRTIRFGTLTTGMTANQVATAFAALVDADGQFTAPAPGAATVDVTDVEYGERQAAKNGVPSTTWTVSTPTPGVGGISNGGVRYYYSVTYLQKDNYGNEVEGIMSEDATDPNDTEKTGVVLSGSDKDVTSTLTNLQAGSGFNTNCAIVNGGQAGVNTITVDSGHTIKVGDTAYFSDGVSGGMVEREVTAIAATTITVAGSAVNVSDNAVISNNLRIRLWRNKEGGTAKFLVAEIANNSLSATQSYVDSKKDSDLGLEYEEPRFSHGLPPKGKYLATWNGVLVVSGNRESPNELFYSTIEGPEYFPEETNSYIVESSYGDETRGIAPVNEVFCAFNEKSVHVFSGDITENLIRRTQILVNEVGAQSHASIQSAGLETYFVDDSGVFNCLNGQLPPPDNEVGYPIKPFFTQNQFFDEGSLALRRSVGFNDRTNERYFLFAPVETLTSGGERYANSESKVLVHDYARNSWFEWRNINAASGFVTFNGEIWFQERRYSSFTSSVEHIAYRVQSKFWDDTIRDFKVQEDDWAYADQREMIQDEYGSDWFADGNPSVWKKASRLKAWVLEAVQPNEFTVTIQTENDYQKGLTDSEYDIVLGSPAEGWGFGQWGQFPWGDPAGSEPQNQRLKPAKYRSQRILFRSKNIHENVVISGFQRQFRYAYLPEMKE